MSENPIIVQEQITIAVDADSCTALTLELAVDIARSVKGQLQGLFIENADLLNSASLPFSREVLLTSGAPRSLNRQIVEENYKRQATKFQRMLSLKASQSVIRYDFRSMAGRRRDVFALQSTAGYIIFERRPLRPQWSHSAPKIAKRILVAGPSNALRLRKALELIVGKLPENAIEIYWLGNTEEKDFVDTGYPKQQVFSLKDERSAEALLNGNLDYILVSKSISASLLNKLISEGQCPIIVVD